MAERRFQAAEMVSHEWQRLEQAPQSIAEISGVKITRNQLGQWLAQAKAKFADCGIVFRLVSKQRFGRLGEGLARRLDQGRGIEQILHRREVVGEQPGHCRADAIDAQRRQHLRK